MTTYYKLYRVFEYSWSRSGDDSSWLTDPAASGDQAHSASASSDLSTKSMRKESQSMAMYP